MPPTVKLQDFPPRQAHLCLDVERFVAGELGVDLAVRTVLVGFSGGADSCALLFVLAALAPRLGCTVHAAHLDHGLRPESVDEARRAGLFCEARGVPLTTGREDVAALAAARGTGIEEAAREARYAFFERTMDACGAHVLALGHTLNDLAEDVLMRLLRGSGWPQLGGMAAWDGTRRLLRPLLLTPRAEVEAFGDALDIRWTEDPSNTDRTYLRNRVRHDILPLFLDENPNFLHHVATLWRMARLDGEHARAETSALLARAEDGGRTLPAALLRELSPSQRLRLYKAALEALGPGQPLADALFRLERAWSEGRPDKTIQFPGPKEAQVSKRGVTFHATGKDAG